MIPNYSKDLLNDFKSFRRTTQEPLQEVKKSSKPKKNNHVPPKNQRGNSNSPYNAFLDKIRNLEETIDTFGTRDLVYYFREIAERNGHKYVVSNIKKDMAIFKRLQESYEKREICGMIEFLYESDQDYIDKDRISPNLLASSWVNTIYADMNLWVDDKYTPSSKKLKPKAEKGEWKTTTEKGTKIGLKL